jgi:hypothetical protein
MSEQNPNEDYLKDAEESKKNVLHAEIDLPALKSYVYQLHWRWADFELMIISPDFTETPPQIILPEELEGGEVEFVYPIIDYGNRLSTSKALEMYEAGMSQCKLFYTIEKIIRILIDKIRDEGIPPEAEVQISFGGFETALRKAFESVINLNYNVVVNNYDPGAWGEMYLQAVKKMAAKYGYPPEAPRDIYRKHAQAKSKSPRQ